MNELLRCLRSDEYLNLIHALVAIQNKNTSTDANSLLEALVDSIKSEITLEDYNKLSALSLLLHYGQYQSQFSASPLIHLLGSAGMLIDTLLAASKQSLIERHKETRTDIDDYNVLTLLYEEMTAPQQVRKYFPMGSEANKKLSNDLVSILAESPVVTQDNDEIENQPNENTDAACLVAGMNQYVTPLLAYLRTDSEGLLQKLRAIEISLFAINGKIETAKEQDKSDEEIINYLKLLTSEENSENAGKFIAAFIKSKSEERIINYLAYLLARENISEEDYRKITVLSQQARSADAAQLMSYLQRAAGIVLNKEQAQENVQIRTVPAAKTSFWQRPIVGVGMSALSGAGVGMLTGAGIGFLIVFAALPFTFGLSGLASPAIILICAAAGTVAGAGVGVALFALKNGLSHLITALRTPKTTVSSQPDSEVDTPSSEIIMKKKFSSSSEERIVEGPKVDKPVKKKSKDDYYKGYKGKFLDHKKAPATQNIKNTETSKPKKHK